MNKPKLETMDTSIYCEMANAEWDILVTVSYVYEPPDKDHGVEDTVEISAMETHNKSLQPIINTLPEQSILNLESDILATIRTNRRRGKLSR